jgi:hypothetical protein
VSKPHKFIGFGDSYGPKPYKFIGFGDSYGSGQLQVHTWVFNSWLLGPRSRNKSVKMSGGRRPHIFFISDCTISPPRPVPDPIIAQSRPPDQSGARRACLPNVNTFTWLFDLLDYLGEWTPTTLNPRAWTITPPPGPPSRVKSSVPGPPGPLFVPGPPGN